MLFDQPADHQEPNESLQGAEILKELADEFKLKYLITFSTGMRLCMALLACTSPSPDASSPIYLDGQITQT
jgi:hypothetical protein